MKKSLITIAVVCFIILCAGMVKWCIAHICVPALDWLTHDPLMPVIACSILMILMFWCLTKHS